MHTMGLIVIEYVRLYALIALYLAIGFIIDNCAVLCLMAVICSWTVFLFNLVCD